MPAFRKPAAPITSFNLILIRNSMVNRVLGKAYIPLQHTKNTRRPTIPDYASGEKKGAIFSPEKKKHEGGLRK